MNAVTRIFHDLTHRVPGVPEHSDSANAHSRRPARWQWTSAKGIANLDTCDDLAVVQVLRPQHRALHP